MSLESFQRITDLDEVVGEGDLQRRLVDHQPVDEGPGGAMVADQPGRGAQHVVDQHGDRAVAIVEGSEAVR